MKIKGAKQYKDFKKGIDLKPADAIWAQCYVCNGQEDSNVDCGALDCTLYRFSPYGRKTKDKK